MEDIQAGYPNEYRAYGQDLPDTEGFYTPAMSREPGQGNEYDTMSMAPSDMMSQYADPAVDAAPNGLFSEETRTMSEIQSQVLTAQSSDANTNDSMGEKKVRKRRRSRGKQACRRGQEEAAMDRLIRGSGMEFGPMAVDPSMQFGPSIELGQPTIHPTGYDSRLGYAPLPRMSKALEEKLAKERLMEQLMRQRTGGQYATYPPDWGTNKAGGGL